MKTFRFIGMALFAVLMCVNFASCSSDDDLNEENDNKKTKKLLSSITFYQVEELNEDWNKTIYQFTYNDEKLLSSVTDNRNDLKIDFEWSSGGSIVDVTVTSQGSVKSEGRYWTDNNDFLWRGEGGYGTEMDIEYDANGHLDRYILKSYKTTKCKWIWSNDNIAKFEYVYDLTNGTTSLDYEETYTYYLDKENKHPIMDIWYSLYRHSLSLTGYDSFLIMAHPSLLGRCNKNLIKSRNFKNDRYSYNIEYAYEFDNENYPTKITETNTINGGSKTYTLTWN